MQLKKVLDGIIVNKKEAFNSLIKSSRNWAKTVTAKLNAVLDHTRRLEFINTEAARRFTPRQ